eukprot:CAMPEP_0184339938 /NCGR_PEP_ID=MMETSP1089-20130417/8622_1 /TAXON_ID=38269 ORGANISM="Gloeochaete wittrockiana, Strain SAG46.84" /NCGR_SAMPLE_ID=MMETSP1089 /ASSEMBLY_ACC=CAM_ASM_000445 /LENGTH=70 /DNA_ID=CAMNT_0026667483 /DNA_START=151 /DNA_END=360 /DNA_ORIENTATION=-
MSQIPEREHPLADPNYVNTGLQNWHALRSAWRERPDNAPQRTDLKQELKIDNIMQIIRDRGGAIGMRQRI